MINPMDELTARQIDILKAIIQEHTETGEPVGSEILEKKYKLGVSPATIRNEMVVLAKKGYIMKSHFSSGRIPSPKGFRFYINKIMKQKEMSTADEVAYKNSVWDERSEMHKLLTQATRVLAQRTGLVSLATTNTGDIYFAGLANLLSIQEFINREMERQIFQQLEQIEYWERLLNKFGAGEGHDIYFVLGDEGYSDPIYDSCASIFGEFDSNNVKGIIGVVGPKRMHYDLIAPQVKYFSELLSGIMKEQKFGLDQVK